MLLCLIVLAETDAVRPVGKSPKSFVVLYTVPPINILSSIWFFIPCLLFCCCVICPLLAAVVEPKVEAPTTTLFACEAACPN